MAPVADAYAKFRAAADGWADTAFEIEQAKEARATAVIEAARAAAGEAKVGKIETDAAAVAAEHDVKLASLRASQAAYETAVHELGNELADAIAEHRADWIAERNEAQAEAEAEPRTALGAVRAAVAKLGPAKMGAAWLETFDAGKARAGEQVQFAGGRVDVNTMKIPRETQARIEAVLDALDSALLPPSPRVVTIDGPGFSRSRR